MQVLDRYNVLFQDPTKITVNAMELDGNNKDGAEHRKELFSRVVLNIFLNTG